MLAFGCGTGGCKCSTTTSFISLVIRRCWCWVALQLSRTGGARVAGPDVPQARRPRRLPRFGPEPLVGNADRPPDRQWVGAGLGSRGGWLVGRGCGSPGSSRSRRSISGIRGAGHHGVHSHRQRSQPARCGALIAARRRHGHQCQPQPLNPPWQGSCASRIRRAGRHYRLRAAPAHQHRHEVPPHETAGTTPRPATRSRRRCRSVRSRAAHAGGPARRGRGHDCGGEGVIGVGRHEAVLRVRSCASGSWCCPRSGPGKLRGRGGRRSTSTPRCGRSRRRG